jgi:hypothetical protein
LKRKAKLDEKKSKLNKEEWNGKSVQK